MEPEEISVVIIDDSTVDRLAVTRALGCCDTLQCQTSEYADPDEAVLALESTHADVVLLDYKFPDGKTGLEALIRMQSTGIDAPVIVLTGCGDEELAVEMLKTGAVYQRDDGDAANLGGLGLGLSLCRDLVELHGGRIWATSELGVGSVFFFTLPLSPDVSNEEKQEQVPEWRHEPMEG